MQAALLPDRGAIKVVGDDARHFLSGLVTNDMAKVTPGQPALRRATDAAGQDHRGLYRRRGAGRRWRRFLPRLPARAGFDVGGKAEFLQITRQGDLSRIYRQCLGVMALWNGSGNSEYGLSFPDPRLPELGSRVILPPHLAGEAAADLGATLVDADTYEAHRIALGVPRGGLDFTYGDAFPHEADMDQLNGVDFDKGCYVGQEVVSRVEHRASARSRVVPIAYDEFAPSSGLPIMAGDKQVGTLGSTARGRGLALVRLDRVENARATGTPLEAGGIAIRVVKPAWATFDWPGEAKVAT